MSFKKASALGSKFQRATANLDALLDLKDALKKAATDLNNFTGEWELEQILTVAKLEAKAGHKKLARMYLNLADGIGKHVDFGFVAGLLDAAANELEKLDRLADKSAGALGLAYRPVKDNKTATVNKNSRIRKIADELLPDDDQLTEAEEQDLLEQAQQDLEDVMQQADEDSDDSYNFPPDEVSTGQEDDDDLILPPDEDDLWPEDDTDENDLFYPEDEELTTI